MIKAVRRCQRVFALSLLALNLSGGRVYATSDACDRTHVYYGPSLAFKMMAKTVGCAAARAPWSRKKDPRSLGERLKRLRASDLAAVRAARLSMVAVLPPSTVTLAALPRRAPPHTLVPLSSELGTAPPLHTRK
jgi:hypothetical protein